MRLAQFTVPMVGPTSTLSGIAINVDQSADKPSRNLRLLRDNRNFALIWTADFVSPLGDRVHQVAMAALVYTVTWSLAQTELQEEHKPRARQGTGFSLAQTPQGELDSRDRRCWHRCIRQAQRRERFRG